MTVFITMKGLLEPIKLEESFMDTMNSMNMAAVQGKEFVATRTDNGDNILIAMRNVLTVIEDD